MNFSVIAGKEILGGVLRYEPDDLSFDFEFSNADHSISTLLVNYLHLAIDTDHKVVGIWGYCPSSTWIPTDATPPSYGRGALLATLDSPLIPGVSRRLTTTEGWRILVNRRAGWVCVGDPRPEGIVEAVEFASGCVAVVTGSHLVALWLHPQVLPPR